MRSGKVSWLLHRKMSSVGCHGSATVPSVCVCVGDVHGQVSRPEFWCQIGAHNHDLESIVIGTLGKLSEARCWSKVVFRNWSTPLKGVGEFGHENWAMKRTHYGSGSTWPLRRCRESAALTKVSMAIKCLCLDAQLRVSLRRTYTHMKRPFTVDLWQA